MDKLIAVQKGLDSVAERLRTKGYAVTDLNGTDKPIDAMVYSENIGYRNPPTIINAKVPSNNQFVMMLNADELAEDEIVNRIDALDNFV